MKKDNLTSFQYEQILLDESCLNNDDINENDQKILKNLKKSNDEILREYPPEIIGEAISNRINSNSKIIKGSFRLKRVYLPLSAAAVLLLFFSIFPLNKQIDSIENGQLNETIRLKGQNPSLYIYRGNESKTELLSNNSLVRENDLLQISYDSAGQKYGVILSIDGRGTVTLHYPVNEYSNTRLDFGGKISLPYSYELDNAPFFEKFFFVTSEDEINVTGILENAGRIARGNKTEMLSLPENMHQRSIILFKEETE